MKQSSAFSSLRSPRNSRWWLLALCCLWSLTAQAVGDNTLEAVEPIAAGGGRVTLRLRLARAAPAPSVFTVNKPARLAIDLADTQPELEKRYQRVAQGPVQAIATAAGARRTRVVVELSRMVAYHIERRGHDILVHLGAGAAAKKTADRESPGTANGRRRAAAAHAGASPRATAVRNIDFRRGEKGAGRVYIALNGANARVNVGKHDGRVIAELPHVSLPGRLQKRLDVTDFATPVKTIDALAAGGGTRIVITPKNGADYEQIAYQTGDDFYIALEPVSKARRAREQEKKPRYTGKKISLSFQSIDVRRVLQIIADVAKVNMVVADSVSGDMALRLADVPWDQALDIIMKAKGLGMTRHDNVISVAPLAAIAAREKAELAARRATENLAPLQSEIIQINYARAADIANLLRSGRAAGQAGKSPPAAPAGNSVSLLSARGKITVDKRTNSLLINDTASKLAAIRKVINRLDIPVRQVQIQSRIVVANRDFTRNLGVSQTGVDNSRLNNALNNGFDANNGGYKVTLPAAGATSLLSSSIITDTFSLNLKLSAMETENQGEIISSPRVITADGQEATIEQGSEIPYQEGSQGSLSGVSVSFKKAVLSLDATPKITPNNKVQMTLKVTQDSVGQFVPTQNGGSVPSIDTRSLTTQVLVNDGDTVVLGGVFEQTNRNKSNGVPLLKDIPLVGVLFRGTQRQRNKQELLIFVTPRILHNDLTANR